MEIFFVKDEMKSAYDKVSIEGDRAKVSVWRDIPANANSETVECMGYSWLLTGRGQRIGEGAKDVFQKFPDLNQIELELVELSFEAKRVDGKGKLQRTVQPKVFLRVQTSRSAVQNQKQSSDELKKLFSQDLTTCLKTGRSLVTGKDIQL